MNELYILIHPNNSIQITKRSWMNYISLSIPTFQLKCGEVFVVKQEKGLYTDDGRPTFRPIHFGPTCFRPPVFVQSISSNPNLT